jgi:hypothetical protein
LTSSRFAATVTALAEALVRERCAGAATADPGAVASVARFLLATHARMPDYLRLPFTLLTLAFDLWPVPSAGRPFHRLPHAGRVRQIRAWQGSRLGVRRDLVKFYETLAVFGWYAEVYGQDYRHDIAA